MSSIIKSVNNIDFDPEVWEKQAAATRERMARGLHPIESMGIDLVDSTPEQATVFAPLEKNLNDKATAFAGSIASVAALAGWSYVTTLAEVLSKQPADVAVFHCNLDYLKPITTDLTGLCYRPSNDELQQFSGSLTSKERAKIAVAVEVLDGNGTIAARMSAKYIAVLDQSAQNAA